MFYVRVLLYVLTVTMYTTFSYSILSTFYAHEHRSMPPISFFAVHACVYALLWFVVKHVSVDSLTTWYAWLMVFVPVLYVVDMCTIEILRLPDPVLQAVARIAGALATIGVLSFVAIVASLMGML